MTQEVRIFEYTSENFYEIVWNARLQYFKQNFSNLDDVQDVLTDFRRMDRCYLWEAHAETLPKAENEPPRDYYTGEVSLIPIESEKANNAFLAAEEAHRKQTEAVLNQINDDTDAIAELGAGYGGNFIRLDGASSDSTGKTLAERGIKLFMAEYTNTGRNLCAEFLKCKNAPQLELFHIDHKDLDLSFLRQAMNPLILTVHSIEQVPELPSDYFKTLSRAAPKVRGIHIEPVGFQFEVGDQKYDTHAKMMKEKNWNQNFADVIKQAEKDGDIIIDLIDVGFSEGQSGNPSTMVTWHYNN